MPANVRCFDRTDELLGRRRKENFYEPLALRCHTSIPSRRVSYINGVRSRLEPAWFRGLTVVRGFFVVLLVVSELFAGGDVEVSYPKVGWARTRRVTVERRAIPGQRWGASYVAGAVHCRTEVDRRRPRIEGAASRRHPDIIRANSGAFGGQKELQPIPPDCRAGFLVLATQLRDEDGGTERPVIA